MPGRAIQRSFRIPLVHPFVHSCICDSHIPRPTQDFDLGILSRKLGTSVSFNTDSGLEWFNHIKIRLFFNSGQQPAAEGAAEGPAATEPAAGTAATLQAP